MDRKVTTAECVVVNNHYRGLKYEYGHLSRRVTQNSALLVRAVKISSFVLCYFFYLKVNLFFISDDTPKKRKLERSVDEDDGASPVKKIKTEKHSASEERKSEKEKVW